MQKLPREELPPGHEGGARGPPIGRAPTSWAHVGPPPLIPALIFFLYLTQTRKTNSSTSSSHFCCDFRSPCSQTRGFRSLCSKLRFRNCFGGLFLGCDSTIYPISFCFSGLYFEGLINLVPLVVSHLAGLPLVSENTCSCPNHFAPLMLLPFDRLTITLKTS